jgi:hypothetical protein
MTTRGPWLEPLDEAAVVARAREMKDGALRACCVFTSRCRVEGGAPIALPVPARALAVALAVDRLSAAQA